MPGTTRKYKSRKTQNILNSSLGRNSIIEKVIICMDVCTKRAGDLKEAAFDFKMGSLSKSVAEFCLDLFHEVNKIDPKKNIFSPMSISAALAMVFLGAKGNTAAQMEKVLLFNRASGSQEPMARPSSECGAEGTELEHHSESEYQPYSSLPKNYIDCTKELYGAIPQTADFKNATEAARQKINSWVESQTQGKIKELFIPGIIMTITVSVLVNAIYFKANWNYKFDKTKTVKRGFRLNQNDKKFVQLMYQQGRFKMAHVQEINAQILELPYNKKSLSMIILLPDDITDRDNGLKKIERTMTAEKLTLWTSSESLMERKMEVYLPRFKLEDMFNLKSSLKEMGMTDDFAELKADLSAISGTNSLYMSEAVHKTYVEVYEEGTEAAAAATGAVINQRSLPSSELFMADHPFFFFIRHNPINTILFFDKLCSP
ncbi:leukocyte elastase inhibitor [Alligator mississippiensis]|uniref:leukocyte elastase inhibitor n=1 Tax=Alligator mississippiensis TaxID=8496 RepID=UPI002877FE24|nr:leukocyte elastase inhibitor [Alligator mississippiensis]